MHGIVPAVPPQRDFVSVTNNSPRVEPPAQIVDQTVLVSHDRDPSKQIFVSYHLFVSFPFRLPQSDFVFVTNNNPRLEPPAQIVDQTVAGFPPHIHSYESLPGRPHWLRDINAPDLGWSEEADELPAPDWSERDHRLECQGMVRCPTFEAGVLKQTLHDVDKTRSPPAPDWSEWGHRLECQSMIRWHRDTEHYS